MPKLGLTILQYLWCWVVVLLIHGVPVASDYLAGYWIYLFIGSLSSISIYLLIKWAGKNYLALGLCSFEFLAILLQLASCYANLTKEVNLFYSNYRLILTTLYELQVTLLTIAGIYGFGILVWTLGRRLYTDRGDNCRKSYVWPLLYERRKTGR